jgi:hypothetical protein
MRPNALNIAIKVRFRMIDDIKSVYRKIKETDL